MRQLLATLSILALILGAVSPARTEEPSASVRLDITLSRKLPTPPQLPDPKVAEKDADEAIAAIKARARSEAVRRQTPRAPFPRPDLNYDVWSGIQSRNINDALRRR